MRQAIRGDFLRRLGWILAGAALWNSSLAHAENRLYLWGALGYSDPISNEYGLNYTGGWIEGLGTSWRWAGSGTVSWEVGALYQRRQFQTYDGVLTTRYLEGQIKVPVEVLFALSTHVSLGVGGYGAQALGNLKINDQDSSYDFAQIRAWDAGPMLSLERQLDVFRSAQIILRAVAEASATNISLKSGIWAGYVDFKLCLGIRVL